MSPDGGVSAGRFGSTSRLDRNEIVGFELSQKDSPAPVQILEVGPVLGLFKRILEIVLDFGYLFQVVGHLEPLHICAKALG